MNVEALWFDSMLRFSWLGWIVVYFSQFLENWPCPGTYVYQMSPATIKTKKSDLVYAGLKGPSLSSTSRGWYTFTKVKEVPIIEQINMVWHIRSKFAKKLGQFGEKTSLNRQNQILVSHLFKSKNLCRPNIGMWGVYPVAMACNVGVLCSDINLGERILR